MNEQPDVAGLRERLRTLGGALADRRRAAERADLAGLVAALDALRAGLATLAMNDARGLRYELTLLLDEAQALRDRLEEMRAALAVRLRANERQRRAEAAYRRACGGH